MKTPNFETDMDAWIAAALLDELTPEERAAFERHLAMHPAAARIYQQTTAMTQQLEETLREERPDVHFENRLIENFRRKAPTSRAARFWETLRRGLRLPYVYLPATVAVLIALVQVGSLLESRVPGNFSRFEGKTIVTAGTLVSADSVVSDLRQIQRAEAIHPEPGSASGNAPRKEGSPLYWTQLKVAAMPASQNTEEDQAAGVPAAASSAPMPITASMADRVATSEFVPRTKAAAPVEPAVTDNRRLIRDASLDLEVKDYDGALNAITSLAAAGAGYVDTKNSERLANGKMSGTVVIKVSPSHLDVTLTQLGHLGEVKNQALTTRDVTREYFDTEARLRNARLMEERLLKLLETMKGKISEMLQVEKELARVRGQIEEMQGELQLTDSLVQYATVTVMLHEKDLNQAAAYLLREQVTLALLTPDVEKTYADVRHRAEAAQAQIVQSNLQHDDADQASAAMQFLVAPTLADEFVAGLRGLGRVQTYVRQDQRVAKDGGENSATASVERDKVEVDLTIARDADAPVQYTQVAVLTPAVEDEAARIKQAAAQKDSGVEVRSSSFERAPDGTQSANLTFRTPLAQYLAFLAKIQALGAVKELSVNRQDRPEASPLATAEISLRLFSQSPVMPDNNGLLATLRRTLAEGLGGMLWSVRMIGVALAFLAPWIIAIALVAWIILRVRRRGGKR